jgi:hypothetical protein
MNLVYWALLGVFILLAFAFAWVLTHPKKTGKMLGLLKFIMVIGLLISPTLAQENDTEIIMVSESKPIIAPELFRSCNLLAEELAWIAGYRAFLGNDTNLTNSTGLFYA